jgi:pyruvate formate lyase activating enzyme
MKSEKEAETAFYSPERLVEEAVRLIPYGNIGIAFTYNEPLISYEYVYDCALLARQKGLKTVLVTNGYICAKPFTDILPYIDAMNIDLKGFTDEFYKKLGGDLDTVKQSIQMSADSCHVEVTTLIIPNENDSDDEMKKLSALSIASL